MSYYNFGMPLFQELKDLTTNTSSVLDIIKKETIDFEDFARLISYGAEENLEEMANRVQKENLQFFGRAIGLYTPLYIANYCVNNCAYCGFNTHNDIDRLKLTMDEIETESKFINEMGLRHILLLTGESNHHTPVSYLKDAVSVCNKYFDSISIEVYPMDEPDYKVLIDEGVSGLTVYQEVYDEDIYDTVHISGPKKNFKYRLDAGERACKAGIRNLNIGSLLGLNDFRKEILHVGLHAYYIQRKYPEVELSVSLPRIKPFKGSFTDISEVSDQNLVQGLLALKLFLPRVSVNMSTRESATFRNNLLNIGVNKISAGVCTEVGGHSKENQNKSNPQFDISDDRSVDEIRTYLLENNFQPVFKDWLAF